MGKLSKSTGPCMEAQGVQSAKPTAVCALNFSILGSLVVWLYKCWVARLQLIYCHLKAAAYFWLSSMLDFITALCICLLSKNYFTIGCSSLWSLSPGNIAAGGSITELYLPYHDAVVIMLFESYSYVLYQSNTWRSVDKRLLLCSLGKKQM